MSDKAAPFEDWVEPPQAGFEPNELSPRQITSPGSEGIYLDPRTPLAQLPTPSVAAGQLLAMTGIPDMEAAQKAAARGEALPALGQMLWGASELGSWMMPVGRGATAVGERVAPGLAEDISGAIRAFHGTPHLFQEEEGAPFGRFRDEAIGSGEGAQAYGYGHYVAGSKGVAESYRPTDFGDIPINSTTGKPLSALEIAEKYYEPGTVVGGVGGGWDKILRFRKNLFPGTKTPTGAWSVDTIKVRPDVKATADYLQSDEYYNNPKDPRQISDLWNELPGTESNHSNMPNQYALKQAIEHYRWPTEQPGALLEVHVLPSEEELLDWDKPISEQSEDIKNKLSKLPEYEALSLEKGNFTNFKLRDFVTRKYRALDEDDPEQTGESFYKRLVNLVEGMAPGTGGGMYGEGPKIASKALHEAGIPGLKYLDQQSRQIGEGTRNYVIFDPSNLRIIGRNGQRLTPVEGNPFEEEK